MPNNPKRPKDVNKLAHELVRLSTGNNETPLPTRDQVSALMAELGRKGGKIGGKRRLETLSAKRRKEIARKAATSRWKKNKNTS